jgi:hypothetical protein
VGQAGVGVHVAGDVDGVGRGAQADDLGVEANGHIDVVLPGRNKKALRASRIHCAAGSRRPCRSAAWMEAAGMLGLKTRTLGAAVKATLLDPAGNGGANR